MVNRYCIACGQEIPFKDIIMFEGKKVCECPRE